MTIVNFFLEKNSQKILYVCTVQVTAIANAMFIDRSKFREQFLKRVTQGTFLRNYFKIWQEVSEEKNFEAFLWSSHSAKSLPPRRPCFLTDQNFASRFWKGSHKEQSWEIIPNSDQRFQRRFLRISSCPYSARSVHSPEPCWRIKISWKVFKRVTQGTFLWNYFKIGPAVLEKILKEFLKKIHLVSMATRVFKGIKLSEQFYKKEDHPRNIPVKFGSNWPSGLGGVDV